MILPVDTAVAVPINLMPLVGVDGVTVDTGVTYDEAGLVLSWNFVTTAGVTTRTSVTPTDTGGVYDFVNNSNGMYEIEIPASGGGTINNDTEGYGWFSGYATAVAPFRGPEIAFVAQQAIDGFTTSVNPIITKTIRLLAALARKDAAAATDLATELSDMNADFGSGAGAYANTTNSLEYASEEATAIGLDVDGLTAAVDALPAGQLTEEMTEAYAADTETLTIAKALYGIHQMLTEFAVSGTTMTVKKRDKSTTAFTSTLNSASDPTSITQAT